MPSPSQSLATLRPDLASFMQFDLEMDRRGFVGQRVLPVFQVGKASGDYGRIPLEQLLQSPDTERAPGSGYSRGKWTFQAVAYATKEQGWEEPIDDNEAEMYVDYFDAEQVSAARAFDFVLRAQESRISQLVFNATTFTPTAVSDEWDDAPNATPIDDVDAAKIRLWDATGLWPNVLIINRRVFLNLRKTDQIIERVKYQNFQDVRASNVTASALAQIFDVDEVIVAGSAENTANEGQTRAIAPLWSDEYAMVTRIARSNDPREPGLGRIFHWPGDGSSEEGTFESYRDERIRGDVIRVRHQVQEQIIYPEAGELLSNITT